MKKISVAAVLTVGSILLAGPTFAADSVTITKNFKSISIAKSTKYFVPIYQVGREVAIDLNPDVYAPGDGCPVTSSGELSDCQGGY